MKTAILIPVRLASTRLPNKPLVYLGNRPLIRRVYNECKTSGFPVFILTDSEEIAKRFPPGVCLIDTTDYSNGTERCAGAISKFSELSGITHFINVQGDMPDITLDVIYSVQKLLVDYHVATVYTKADLLSRFTNTVKIVHNGSQAHWFMRSSDYEDQHLGIYGYSRTALNNYTNIRVSDYETKESLEQLRWYNSGYSIGVSEVDFTGVEINDANDVIRWHKVHGYND